MMRTDRSCGVASLRVPMTDRLAAQLKSEVDAANDGRPIDMTSMFAMSIEATDDMVLAMRPDGRMVYGNKKLRLLFGGLSLEELQGASIFDHIPAGMEEMVAGVIERALAVPMGATHREDLRTGEAHWTNMAMTAWPGRTGEPALITAVGRDRTEHYTARHQLEETNRRLTESNRDLQDFAYVASHDLQEPLRKIIAFSDRLTKMYGDDLDETALDYLQRVQGASARMQRLIEDLLAFSRVAARPDERQATDLGEVVETVISDLDVAIEESGAQIHIGQLPTVAAEQTQMRQLFQNLIGNALKFRKPDVAPVISVQATRRGTAWRIVVTDNGIGFHPKYEDKIFTVFQRLHSRDEYEGSGIGLSVCRRIVERHDGAMSASGSPGEGATFTVTLPAGP